MSIMHAAREQSLPAGKSPVSFCKPLGVVTRFTRKRFDTTHNQADVTCKACLKLMSSPSSTSGRGF